MNNLAIGQHTQYTIHVKNAWLFQLIAKKIIGLIDIII